MRMRCDYHNKNLQCVHGKWTAQVQISYRYSTDLFSFGRNAPGIDSWRLIGALDIIYYYVGTTNSVSFGYYPVLQDYSRCRERAILINCVNIRTKGAGHFFVNHKNPFLRPYLHKYIIIINSRPTQ